MGQGFSFCGQGVAPFKNSLAGTLDMIISIDSDWLYAAYSICIILFSHLDTDC